MFRPANPELVEWVSRESKRITETYQKDLCSKNKKLYLTLLNRREGFANRFDCGERRIHS
jgi:hypothetical protein